MKIIKTSKGEEVLVDDEDFEFLSNYKWHTCNGYVNRSKLRHETSYKDISMHRMIMKPPENMTVDHINFNKFDNRKCNLRIVTASENSKRKPPRKKKPPKVLRSKLVLHVSDEEREKIMELFNSFRKEEMELAEARKQKLKLNLPELSNVELSLIEKIAKQYRKEV